MTNRNEAIRRMERLLNSNFRSEATFRMNAEESTSKNIQPESTTKTKKAQEETKQAKTYQNQREE